LYVGNYYKHARDIPDANVLYLQPTPTSYTSFAGATLAAFFGSQANAHIADVVIAPGSSFYMNAGGLVSGGGCTPINRFSATAPYALAFSKTQILSATLSYNSGNGYFRNDDDARAFDSSTGWLNGLANNSPTAKHHF